MEKKIPSQALDVNLAETRGKEIIIPKEHQWFLSLSEQYWGIHTRTMEFLQEFHHKYSALDIVLKQIDKIAIEDSWLYEKSEDPAKAFELLIDFFKILSDRPLTNHQKEHWIRSYARFLEKLVAIQNIDHSVLQKAVSLLLEKTAADEVELLKNTRFVLRCLNGLQNDEILKGDLFSFFKSALIHTAVFWKKSYQLKEWSKQKHHLFTKQAKQVIESLDNYIESLEEKSKQIEEWSDLEDSVFYKDVAEHLRHSIHDFESTLERIYFLQYLVYLSGMSHLRDHLLWDINAQFKNLSSEENLIVLQQSFDNIFSLFKDMFEQSADIVLDCQLTLGKNIIPTKDQPLIDDFITRTIELGFVSPSELSYSEDWQLQLNPNHVKNVRVWLQLFELDPSRMKRLLSALIVYLRVGGIFISDTDLFQKDISRLLNADISSCFKPIKQLCRIFPIYFNEVGAEGDIRDFSTAIDELFHRKDRLIHFYRKQIHTESNNRHIELTRAIILYWLDGSLHGLDRMVPESVLMTMSNESEVFVGVHDKMKEFFSSIELDPKQFLAQENRSIFKALSDFSQDDRDCKRIWYLLRLYTLLRDKYSLDTTDIIQRLHRQTFLDSQEIDELAKALAEDRFEQAISLVFDVMEELNGRVLDEEKTTAQENIYYKRHIAVGIPSMYGEYREQKFEALGLIFRLEQLVARLFEKVIDRYNVQVITIQSLQKIYAVLKLFQRGLILDGMDSPSLQSNLEMLKYSLSTASFSIGQYANIFQFMAKNVKELISAYFLRVYERPLELSLPKILGSEAKSSEFHRVSEKFYREILSSGFLIQSFDEYVTKIGKSLLDMEEHIDPDVLKSMLSINVDMTMTSFMNPEPYLDNQIFLGAKAYFLKLLYQKGLPVPPGFILTTELFRHLEVIRGYSSMREDIDNRIFSKVGQLEKLTKLNFGDPNNPLLLSVRSGTTFSMPGAMNTFLNIGLNDEIAEAQAKDPKIAWGIWDAYRRLLQSWGMAHGVPRDTFDDVMTQYKDKYDIELKADFSADQMHEISQYYKQVLSENNIVFEQNVNDQLERAIVLVMESWNSKRCLTYRRHLQVAEEWGTAVVIQQMVMGNLKEDSGTGVVFTHNPKSSKAGINLYGDFVFRSQGEDIVGGLVHAQPISKNQGNGGEDSLEVRMPLIYQRLKEISTALIEDYGFTHQEIEFTFESSDPESLYILQIRDQVISKPKARPVFSSDPEEMEMVGRGIGIGGGALTGRLAFTLDDISRLRKKHPNCTCVLVRPDTVPDDIEMIFKADALITARGGTTSHAAVTASRLGKVCIVNCRDLVVVEEEGFCCLNGVELRFGDQISIDGSLGTIYLGAYDTVLQEVDETL